MFISRKPELAMSIDGALNLALDPSLYERHMIETAYTVIQRESALVGYEVRRFRNTTQIATYKRNREILQRLQRAERACRSALRHD